MTSISGRRYKMWNCVFILYIWYAVSLVTVAGLGPTWVSCFLLPNSSLNPADSDVRVKVREFIHYSRKNIAGSGQRTGGQGQGHRGGTAGVVTGINVYVVQGAKLRLLVADA